MKKQRKKNKYYLLVIPIIILVGLVFFSLKKFVLKKGNYKIESRTAEVEKVKINSTDFEAIGWLRVEGTSLDLPVVWSESQSSNFPVELESFVWSMNSDKKFHNLINIMGHNIFNLSANPKKKSEYFKRFEEIMSFVYYDFAKENKYVQLTLDGEEHMYKIFAVGFIPSVEVSLISYAEDDYTESNMSEYLDKINSYSIYDYGVDVNSKDNIISLLTCTRFFGPDDSYDFFVNAREVRSGEKINNYKVKKNKNYERVEKNLKGDDNDDNKESV